MVTFCRALSAVTCPAWSAFGFKRATSTFRRAHVSCVMVSVETVPVDMNVRYYSVFMHALKMKIKDAHVDHITNAWSTRVCPPAGHATRTRNYAGVCASSPRRSPTA